MKVRDIGLPQISGIGIDLAGFEWIIDVALNVMEREIIVNRSGVHHGDGYDQKQKYQSGEPHKCVVAAWLEQMLNSDLIECKQHPYTWSGL